MEMALKLFVFFGCGILVGVASQGLLDAGRLISNQINKFLPINLPLIPHARPKPSTCSLCALKNAGKCPNEISKSDDKDTVGQYQQYPVNPLAVNNNGFMDLIAGILRSVHTSTQADVDRAREKEEREKLMGSHFHNHYYYRT